MNPRRASLLLYLVAKLRPEAWDAIIPHGPRISRASREYMIAMALKGFSSELGNRAVTQKLAGVQKSLVTFAAGQLAADFDDDNWCPTPWPRKFPGLGPSPDPWSWLDEVALNPQPLPPKELQREIGGYLVLLAEATSLEGVSKDLQNLGKGLLSSKTGRTA